MNTMTNGGLSGDIKRDVASMKTDRDKARQQTAPYCGEGWINARGLCCRRRCRRHCAGPQGRNCHGCGGGSGPGLNEGGV
jgi:hypothetical protein